MPAPGDCLQSACGDWSLVARERVVRKRAYTAHTLDMAVQVGAHKGVVDPARSGNERIV
jgi:hypothetical protein